MESLNSRIKRLFVCTVQSDNFGVKSCKTKPTTLVIAHIIYLILTGLGKISPNKPFLSPRRAGSLPDLKVRRLPKVTDKQILWGNKSIRGSWEQRCKATLAAFARWVNGLRRHSS